MIELVVSAVDATFVLIIVIGHVLLIAALTQCAGDGPAGGAHDGPDLAATVRKLGGHGFLRKPFTGNEVRSSIAEALSALTWHPGQSVRTDAPQPSARA